MSNVYDALIKTEQKNEATRPLNLSWRDIGLESKIMILVFEILFIVIVNQLMARALRSQIDERAGIMATNLSDAAGGYLVSKDVLRLKTMVVKYARLNGVAYALITDRGGKVIANSSASFSPQLQEAFVLDPPREMSHQKLTLEGKTVYETREPILEGQLGAAHVGIWADAVEQEIRQVLFMFLWPITFLLIAASFIAVLLARRLVPSLWRLIEFSGRIRAGQAGNNS